MIDFEHMSIDEFNALTLNSETAVVGDVYASWCAPCKQIAPQLVALSKEYPDVRFIAIQADSSPEHMQAVKAAGVSTVPTVIVAPHKDVLRSVFTGPSAAMQVRAKLASL